MTRIMLEEKKFKKEGERFGILKTIATKNNWPELKIYFDEKNKISKKSKFKSESPSFFQKRNQKIENFEKNPVKLVYLKFFFYFRGYITN